MGRMILHVDVLEILSLAWDHPLVTGGLALLFTPPLFPVLVFFSPLLISTALCAVALISVGHQIEATREREIAGWNARVVEGDGLLARMTNARSTVAGGESWADWVQGMEPGSDWNSCESAFMYDIKAEGLKAEFGLEDGGIGITHEDFEDYRAEDSRAEDSREYERSFSFRTNVTDSTDAASAEGAPFTAEQEAPFPRPNLSSNSKGSSESPIVPFFLYNLRTAGMGTASKFNNLGGALATTAKAAAAPEVVREEPGETEPAPFGSFSMSEIIDAVERATQDERCDDPQPEHQRSMFEKGSIPTAVASHVSSVVQPTSTSFVPEKPKFPTWRPAMADRLPELEFPGFATTTDMGKDSPKSLQVPQRTVTATAGAGPTRKHAEESSRAPNHNAKLRVDNAVIYSASSDSGSKAAGLNRHGSSPRKTSVNPDRRGPSRQRKRPFY